MPPLRTYRASTPASQRGCARTSATFLRLKRNGVPKPFLRLYSRFAVTAVSTVTISASKPAAATRSMSWCVYERLPKRKS